MATERPQVQKPHPAVTIAVTLWLTLTIAITIKILVSPDQHTVYHKMAARAIAWWSGRSLYTQYEDLGRFPYSPTFAITLTPLALLGNHLGAVLWNWLSIAVYLLGLRRLVRDVLPGSWPAAREATLMMLAMIGAIRGLWNAQSNALIIGLVMLGASAIARRRWWQAAGLLGAPVFIKLWAAALTALLAAMVPRKLASRIIAVLAAGALLPFLTQPPNVVHDQYRAWAELLSKMSGEAMRNYRDGWTLLRICGADVPTSLYRLIQLGAAGAGLGWCLWLKHKGMPPRRLLTLTLSVGAAWALVLGPAVEYNTFVVLAPMISWAVLEAFEFRRGRVLAATAFFMTMILASGAIERALLRLSSAALFILPVGTVLFVGWLVSAGVSDDHHSGAIAAETGSTRRDEVCHT